MKATAAVAVGGTLAGGMLTGCATVTKPAGTAITADTIRVGLIGCGGRGTGAAAQALRADPGAVLTAMGDVFYDRLDASLKGLNEEFAGEADRKIQVPPERRFTGFEAYQQVLDSGVDVVLLATPPGFRPAHLSAAVAAGKHIFAEKPMAVDGPGVRRVLEACRAARERGLSIVSGFCWRYADAERETFRRVNDGEIGEVVTVHTTYHSGTLGLHPRRPEWTDMEFQIRNWWHFNWLSGDHIVEQAVHSIDKLAWAMGDRPPVACEALGGRQARPSVPETGNVYDHFAAVYEFENGQRCFHTSRQIDGCPSDNSDYIYGSDGSCEVNGWKPVHALRDRRGKVWWSYEDWRGRLEGRDMYQNEMDALFASVRTGAAVNDGEQMCRSTLMAIMGRMAAYTGQRITWEQAMASHEDLSPPLLAWGPLPVRAVAVPGKQG